MRRLVWRGLCGGSWCVLSGAVGLLFAQRVACGAQCELNGFTRDALYEGTNCPAETARDRAREREGFDLQGEAAVALFVAPVGIEAPEEAVLFSGAEDAFVEIG